MRLVSGSLRKPKRSLTPVSFSSPPGDISRRRHCVLAAAHACHSCHRRHLGRLCKIHRVRTVPFSGGTEPQRTRPVAPFSPGRLLVAPLPGAWSRLVQCFPVSRSFVKCCGLFPAPPSSLLAQPSQSTALRADLGLSFWDLGGPSLCLSDPIIFQAFTWGQGEKVLKLYCTGSHISYEGQMASSLEFAGHLVSVPATQFCSSGSKAATGNT